MIALSKFPSAAFYTVFATSSGLGQAPGVSNWRVAAIPSSPPAEPDAPIAPDYPEEPDFSPDDVPPKIDDPPPDVVPEPLREPPVMPRPRRADVGPSSGDRGCGHNDC
jgi:hypothetical protein